MILPASEGMFNNMKKQMIKKRIIAGASILLLLCGCSNSVPASVSDDTMLITPASETEPQTLHTETSPAETSETTEPAVTYTTVTFTALGDNLIHSSIYKQAQRRAAEKGMPEGSYDFEYAYLGAEELIGVADITVLNQETLICNDLYEPSTYPRFNSPTDLGDYMEKLGVDVFTIANNHVLDKGEDGLAACLDYYDENDMIRVGAYRNAEDREALRTIEKDGVTVSFLCYTEYLNGLSLSEDSELEIGMLSDEERMLSEVNAAKEQSDICIVSLHWGVEDSDIISDSQRSLAEKLGEAGADVIIGTHPHVLRDIELIELSDGRELLCAYSLGNFISAQSVGRNLIGGTLDFSVTVSSDEDEQPKISDIRFNPIITHYDSNYANVRLYRLEDYTSELAASHGVCSKSKFSLEYIYEYLEKHGLWENE